jgi:ADP-ribose pyrophosphatase YjhB (NUDIX family)
MERYCIKCGKTTAKKHDSLFICEAGHENWINPAVGAIVYVIKDGKVLFGVRSVEPNSGKLSLPGGFVDVNETAEQAAIREAKEELGIDVVLQDCLGTYATTYGNRPILNIVFVANCQNQNITPGDDMNGGEPVWREVEDLPIADELAWDWYQSAQKDLLAWWHKNPQS